MVIDPGHGGVESGAISTLRHPRRRYTLDTSLRLRDILLKRGYNVQMTRTTDTLVPLQDRAAFANRFRDGIFVCIHYNAGSEARYGHRDVHAGPALSCRPPATTARRRAA